MSRKLSLPFAEIIAPDSQQNSASVIKPLAYATKRRFSFNLNLLASVLPTLKPKQLFNFTKLDGGSTLDEAQQFAIIQALCTGLALIQGPPGTGKSSLTFALAGVFGLDIHVVSLLEPTLTEEELGMLFTNLPARCIVLLEDIDTAGLIREPPDADEKNAASTASDPASNELNVMNLTKALKKANQLSEEEKKKGISLSGLLNIIDGVASHEGRVLVMTTNHPEKLDDALIRPGRVDHQVAFSNATKSQIKELFKRMYSNDLLRTKEMSPPASAPSSLHVSSILALTLTPVKSTITSHNGNAIGGVLNGVANLVKEKEKEEIGEEDLSSLAEEFAKEMEDDIFSPAEIQGFFLKRKKDPRRAVEDVGQWVKGMVEIKKKGTKLVKVQ